MMRKGVEWLSPPGAAHGGRRPLRWHGRWVLAVAITAVGAIGAGEPEAERESPEQASASASTQAVPAARQADNVAIITINGPIDRWTAMSMERRLKRAEEGGADAVVFEIDSPGGAVGAVLEITSMIKNSSIANTVAWVNPEALSGGAIIALACREIIVAEHATLGDAAPILAGPFGSQSLHKLMEQMKDPTLREKFFAPLLTDMVDSARRNGYDEKLIQGMLMLDVELWLVEDERSGKRYFLDSQEFSRVFGARPSGATPTFSSPMAERAPEDRADSVGSSPRQPEPDNDGFKPASPSVDEETIKSIETTLQTPSGRPSFTRADREHLKVIEFVSDGTTLLTLNTEQSKRFGLAVETINSDEALKKFFGADHLRRLSSTWSESLARFLSSLPVRGLLIVVFLLALFMEMASPGLGLAGAVSLGCLAALVAPQFLAGAAAWWQIVAILAGVLLIATEIFLLPGFGIFGIGGVLLLFAGLLGVVVGPGGLFPETPGERQDLLYGLATLMLAMFTAGVGMYFLAKQYASLPVLNRLVLQNPSPDQDEEGASASVLGAMRPASEQSAVKAGDIGEAITPLRPAGRAEFGDHLLDVVCEMGFIPQGAKVRIVEVGRFRTVVERIEDASAFHEDEGAGA